MPPVTLGPAEDGCSSWALIRFGPDQAHWSLQDGALVRSLNGRLGQPLGQFSRLCFQRDPNGLTVSVTLEQGGGHRLTGGATPRGGF